MLELCNAVGNAMTHFRAEIVLLDQMAKQLPADSELRELLAQDDRLMQDLEDFHSRLCDGVIPITDLRAEFECIFRQIEAFHTELDAILPLLLN